LNKRERREEKRKHKGTEKKVGTSLIDRGIKSCPYLQGGEERNEIGKPKAGGMWG